MSLIKNPYPTSQLDDSVPLDQIIERMKFDIRSLRNDIRQMQHKQEDQEARLQRLENPPLLSRSYGRGVTLKDTSTHHKEKVHLNSWDSTASEDLKAFNREELKAQLSSGNFGVEEGFKRKGF